MILILTAALLAAQPLDCQNAMAQQDMNRCAARDAEVADAELNQVFRDLLRDVQRVDRASDSEGEGERRLRAAQRAWIVFREAECELAGFEAVGGSMEPMLRSGCAARMAERRTSELRLMMAGR